MGMDYVFFAEFGLAGTAGIYAFYQLVNYGIQKGKFAAMFEPEKARKSAEELLSHTSSLPGKIVYAGRRYAANDYLKSPNIF